MSAVTTQILNIAAYKFVDLNGKRLLQLQSQLKNLSTKKGLKGTILLSPEGINLFLAGEQEDVKTLWFELTRHSEFSDMSCKRSMSLFQPFKRMRVKIKDNIIPMNDKNIQPTRFTGNRIQPRELRRWLDEGRKLTLLDTRNRYEVEFGTFNQARDLNIKNFRSFPKALSQLEPELKQQPVVIFCTGGIRCEKAAPLMAKARFKNIYLLDGGILKYFEDCGDAHYDGECFVFDERVALNSDLKETGTVQCAKCFRPVRPTDQKSPKYVPGICCPQCKGGGNSG